MGLGVSTIVMLVIAIVIIGAGIAFITGFIGDGSRIIRDAFDIVVFEIEPDRTTPLVLASGANLKVPPNAQGTLVIGLYNKDNEGRFYPEITCINEQKDPDNPELLVSPIRIGSGEIGKFQTVITTQSNQGFYVCTLKAYRVNEEGEDTLAEESSITMELRN